MNFAIIINVYIDIDIDVPNPFDHPTNLERFMLENTLCDTIDSINEIILDDNDQLNLYIIGTATQENRAYDNRIREEIRNCFIHCKYNYLILTNSDILSLREESDSEFFSVSGYPELRNIGFLISAIMDEEILIQIDDDELLKPMYIKKLKEVLTDHPDKYIFTAPYEKNGTVRILTEDPLVSWKKFSPMDKDMVRFYVESNELKESLFGFGGNMIIRKAFFEKIFYPTEVPRGEDFSMLLASRLIFENGNPLIGLKKGNPVFRSFFLPYEELTIIHKPPFEAKKDFLKYFENNMKRFIMEWGIFSKQTGLTKKRMEELSFYIKEMIGHDDMRLYLEPVFDELTLSYPQHFVKEIKDRLLETIIIYEKIDRWEEYKIKQKLYIKTIEQLKTEKFSEMIIRLGSNVQ